MIISWYSLIYVDCYAGDSTLNSLMSLCLQLGIQHELLAALLLLHYGMYWKYVAERNEALNIQKQQMTGKRMHDEKPWMLLLLWFCAGHCFQSISLEVREKNLFKKIKTLSKDESVQHIARGGTTECFSNQETHTLLIKMTHTFNLINSLILLRGSKQWKS